MAVSYIRPTGGISSANKALLSPKNIRAGIHIQGSGLDVTGTLKMDVKDSKALNFGWNINGGAEATAEIAYTVTSKCNYLLIAVISGIAGYIDKASTKTNAGSTLFSTYYKNNTTTITYGVGNPGDVLTASATGRSGASYGTCCVAVLTDE